MGSFFKMRLGIDINSQPVNLRGLEVVAYKNLAYTMSPKTPKTPIARRGFFDHARAVSMIGLAVVFAVALPVPAGVPSQSSLSHSIKDVAEPAATGPSNPHQPFISRHTLNSSEASAPLEFEVALKMRNFDELQARLAHGERIPAEEMAAKYNPTDADYKKVSDWLAVQGFEVTRRDKNNLAIFVRGKVSRIQTALQVSFARVSLEGSEYTSAVTAPTLPADLASVLVGINGLQPHLRMHRHAIVRPSSLSDTNPPYLPRQIAQAYNATGLYTSGVTGTGQSIAIVIDTFPAKSDLISFWSTYGVSQSINNISFIQVVAGTLPAPEGEETLDTEWSSSIAPGAKVRVYAAQSLDFPNLDQVYQQVYADVTAHPEYGIHQMSMSYGIGESYTSASQVQTDDQYFAELASAGVTVFASSGDSGSTPGSYGAGDESGPIQVQSPASDPNVTGVGGTSLTLDASGNESSETAWNNSYGATGGGISQYFSRPFWQNGTGVPAGTARLIPDVAAAADPVTGAVVYMGGSQTAYGGTSWSSPTWAAFCALINQTRASAGKTPLGLFGPYLYPQLGTANLRDITSGSNATYRSSGSYSAGLGYDLATGVGVPNVQSLAQTLGNFVPGVPKAPAFTSSQPPANVSVNSVYSFTFSASGYPAPVFLLTSGSLPGGLTLSPQGVLSGTLNKAGVFQSTVTASDGVNPSASVTFITTVANSPTAPTFTNGPATASALATTPYSFTYTAVGYPAPTFSLKSGTLPPGLTLSALGTLSGTPTQAGTYSGTISAANGVSPNATQDFSITIQQPIAPSITNGPAPAIVNLNASYSYTFTSAGFPAPTFSVSAGSLPPGLSLSSAGVLSGTPTVTGVYTGTISADNGFSPAATQNFSITVEEAPTITSTPLVAPVAINAEYDFTFTSTSYPPPTYSVTAGSLPPGLTLSSSGVLSGSATQTGTFTGTITATNAAGSTSQTFTITVQANLILGLTMPANVNEDDPDGTGSVTINATSSSDTTITLTSSNTGAITVPATVVVPAGQTNVTFPYTIIDNLNVFGTQTAKVTAHIAGWVDGAQVVTVTDNKTTASWSTYGNGQAHTGVYRGPLLGGTYTQAWSASFPSTAALNQVAIDKGIAYVTPNTDDGISDLTAVNATTGAQLWQHVYSATGNVETGVAYFSINPPTVYKGNVYVQQGQGTSFASTYGTSVEAALWSFNATTGQTNWTTNIPAQWEGYLAPTVYQSVGIWVDGGEYGGLYGISFDGSEKAFQSEPQTDYWTPTYYNGTIYTWVNSTFSAFNQDGKGSSFAMTVNSSNWGQMYCAAPIANDLAYLQGGQFFSAVNVATQTQAWQVTGNFKGTPALANGMAYVLSGSQVQVLNGTTGALVNTFETNDTSIAGQPVVASDSLVVPSSANTYLFNLQTGALVQTIPYGGPVSIAGGVIYIAGSDGSLHAFHQGTALFHFAADGSGGLTSYGYNATGQSFAATLGALPTAGTVLTVINNTGTAPITGAFSNLPNGGTINLVYDGTTYTFTANYSGGDGNDLTLTYTSAPPQAPQFVNAPPPSTAIVPFAYNFAFNASGYPAPSFSVTSGSLPPGLTLSAAGLLSGAPTQPGTYTGMVQAANGVSPVATQNFSITVGQATTPAITSGSPPASVNIDGEYSFTFATTGYPAPTFSVTSGTLPPGITLTSAGVLSGTATQVGNFTVTITASNGFGASATQTITIVVQQVPVITSAPVAVPILLDAPYALTLTATGNPTPAFAVTAGSLPPGLTLSGAGLLSGTPTNAGSYTGTITVTNSSGSASQPFNIVVQSTPALMVVLPSSVNEADPDGQGAVLLNTAPTSAVTVSLASSNTGALTVPASVTIPAGQQSVVLPYTIIDNLAVYGSQTSTVTGEASGWTTGSQIVTVNDNKTTDDWASYGNGQAHPGYYPGNLLGSTYTQSWSAAFPSGTQALNQVAVSQGKVYVTPVTYFGISDLTALDAVTGTQLWQHVFSPTANSVLNVCYFSINPPTVYKGEVYVQQGGGIGGTANTGSATNPELWSFNASTGAANWTAPFNAQWERYLAPTVHQSIGICVDGGEYGGLYSFDFTGHQDYFASEGQYDQWTPTYYDGLLYTWVDGIFEAVNPASGATLWSVGEPYYWGGYSMNCAAPIANNLAYCNGGQTLAAVNLTTESTAWTVSGNFVGTPAINNGLLYVISGSNVDVLNAATGATVGTLQTSDTGLTGQPVVSRDALVVSSTTATYLFNLQTGALVQTIPYGGPVSAALGNLYIAGSDGVLHVYHQGAVSLNLASSSATGETSFGYAATGQTLNLTLGYAPAPGDQLTLINNTSSNPISGTFTNLANGATINLTYGGASYSFIANYAGGDGNDLTLTYAPPGGGIPNFTTGSQPIAMVINSPFSFTYKASGYPAPVFTVTSGSLPPGVTLSSSGYLSGTPTQGGAYSGTITASNGIGSPATQNFTITVSATFAQWESAYLTAQQLQTAAVSSASATPMHDGIPNLLKYFVGIDPTKPVTPADRSALPTLGYDTTTTAGTSYLTMTYRENELASGMAVNVQTSTDMVTWQTVTPNFTRNLGTDSTTGDPIVEVEVKTGSTKQQFIRLNLSMP